jgi:ABC-type nitrate/sulfonate/bicarbonate transport system substrate-binding protein
VQIVIRRGQDQNAAFAHDECDALYAHTPYLETALDDQDAVMLVNQSAGEVPQLGMRQIHALVARDDFLGPQRATVAALVRAIARAESLVHTDLAGTEDAVMRALPSMDRRHLHTLLGLYQAAVPSVPHVSVDGLAPALALFPASRTPPSLEGVPLADFIAPDLTIAPGPSVEPFSAPSVPTSVRSPWSSWPRLAAVALALLALAGMVSWLRRGRARQPS